MKGVQHRRFRANPGYQLVLLDRLTAAERELVAGASEPDGDLYGVLRPRAAQSGLEPRSVSSETALLFLTLGEPGPPPAYLLARLGAEVERTVARLVLDGVLEIEDEGCYRSGTAAAKLLLPASGWSSGSGGGRGRIGELTVAALRYGQELHGLPEPLVAARLYGYGRQPVTQALERQLPDQAAVAGFLGIAPGGSARSALEAGWLEVPPDPGQRARWHTWRARAAPGSQAQLAGANYKLYVSSALQAVGTVVATVASSLAAVRGVSAFKVGCDLPGICRPDKLVVYFDRLEDLQQAAATLAGRLTGCPAHGVPFSAAVTLDGLLSWGADPPARAAVASASADGTGAGGTSWRMWVTERLAEYLVLARDADVNGLEPWRFALERLRLGGIDTDTWVPASGMWPEALASG